MRINDRVVYVDSSGNEHLATVTGLVGTGLSGYKRLSLVYAGKEQRHDVAHAHDAKTGHVHWKEVGTENVPEPTLSPAVEEGPVPFDPEFHSSPAARRERKKA